MIVQITDGKNGPVAVTVEGDVMYVSKRSPSGDIVTTKDIVDRDPGEDQRMTFIRQASRKTAEPAELTHQALRTIHEANVEKLRTA